jgi:phage terminase large subunit
MSRLTDQDLTKLARFDKFASGFLGMQLHPTQAAVLAHLSYNKSRVVARCGNEVGKTSRIVTAAVLAHLTYFPRGTVVSTAGAWRQVKDQLIPNLKRHSHLFPAWRFLDTAISVDGINRYVGFSTRDEGMFQGYHGENEQEPLMIILDEAGAVPASIFLAAEERCRPHRLLILGSTLGVEGKFYEINTRLAKHYKIFKLPATECTRDKGYWLDPADIQRTIDKYGRDHPITLSSIYAEFPGQVEGALMSLLQVETCMGQPPSPVGKDRHCFCDFAAGGDENVCAVRVGNQVWIEKAWRETNTMSAVGQFVRLFTKLHREHGFQAHEISGDGDGLGKPMVDAIHEAGWPIGYFHGGAAPRADDHYKNRISEVWGEGAARIRSLEVALPDDADLKGQLVSRTTKFDSKGKLWLESKEDMRRRGLGSPDRADAVLGVMMPPLSITVQNVMGVPASVAASKADPFSEQDEGEQEMVIPGSYFG